MASPSKQPPPPAKKPSGSGGGGWGSLLSGAVAGLESRLDTILANEEGAAAEVKEGAAAKTGGKAVQRPGSAAGGLAPTTTSTREREVSRTRRDGRLAERLAKATAAKTGGSGAGSAVPSRVGTPVEGEGRGSGEVVRSVPDIAQLGEGEDEGVGEDQAGTELENATAKDHAMDIPGPAISANTSARPSMDVLRESMSSRPSSDFPNGNLAALSGKSAAEYEAELHTYMEKIDALQAKLSYLANSTVAAAKAANAASDTSTSEKQLVEKDEQIALLMQEGEKLSKTEMKHLHAIKKMRAQRVEDDKAAVEARKRAEKIESELRQRVRKAEQAERAASERNKVVVGIEKEVDELRVDRERAAELVKSLTVKLKDASDRAEKAEKEVREKSLSEADRGRIAALENDLEDAQIEKKLAEDRAAAEMKRMREEAEAQQQRFSVKELELKNEVAGLESRLEALRSRVEEQGVEGTGAGEGNVQLLRQVETLQRQYAVAKENWEAIEASLNGRLGGLEREREEVGRREVEARKRVRELGSKVRRAEEELDGKSEEMRKGEGDLERERQGAKGLEVKLEAAQRAAEDVRAEAERQKRVWEVEVQQRVEEERLKWSQGRATQYAPPGLRTQSPATNSTRKVTTTDVHNLHSSSRRPGTNRLTSHDLANLHTGESTRPTSSSRRSFNHPTTARQNSTSLAHASPVERSFEASPAMSRQESSLSLTTPTADDFPPPTPSLDAQTNDGHTPALGETPHTPSSTPTLADLLSTSTFPAAGPSVQLVERMSLLVRRLETEKSSFKDEIARLSSQRDSARNEVVALMREVETKRGDTKQVEVLEREARELRGRYEACLQMLGEREEEVGELRGDVGELKRLYRELVERKVGGVGG